jgi:hypothetical protein
MLETQTAPFYRSYLLGGKNIYLDKISELSDDELHMLNIENKQSEEAGPLFRRLKIAGYFQAAIKLELKQN